MMHYFVCILYSEKIDKYYIGSSQNISKRLQSHLSNHIGFTCRAKDWVLVYQESFKEKETALFREKKIKSWKSRKMIQRLIAGNLKD